MTDRTRQPAAPDRRADSAWDPTLYQPLRWAFGLVPLLAGLDKFFNVLADWSSYLSPAIAELLPIDVATFMGAIGVVEMAVGVLVLSRFTRLGAYLAAGWLTLIALQLLLVGILDVAVRDLVMAVAAYTLARLTEARVADAEVASPRS